MSSATILFHLRLEARSVLQPYIKVSRSGDAFALEGRACAMLGTPVEPDCPGGARQGIFAEWRWDGRRLVLRNDRYGYYPVYYHQTPSEVVVADTPTRVVELGAPADLDHDALAVFLRLQTYVGDDTPFRAVRRLPPGAELIWSADGCEVRWARPMIGPSAIGRADAMNIYTELFRAAIRRRMGFGDGRRAVLPLSGGQDSRHLLLELTAQGFPVAECVTVAAGWSPKLLDDARVASLLTGAIGALHTVLDVPDDFFTLEAEKDRLTGFCTTEHAWILPLADHLRGRDAVVHDGIAGDILSAGTFLEAGPLRLYRDGNLMGLAESLLGAEGSCRGPLSPAFYARVDRERAVRRLVTELEQHAGAHNPLSQFYLWNRTRRSIALSPYTLLGRGTAVDSPFLDHELYDFLASLPAEMILDHGFHGETLRAAYPQFAAIPFAKGIGPVSTRSGPFRRFAWQLLRSLLTDQHADWSMFQKPYVLSRLGRALADPRFAISSHWLVKLTSYLTRLGSIVDRRVLRPHAPG